MILKVLLYLCFSLWLLLNCNINSSASPSLGFLFPPSKLASVTFVWLCSETSQRKHCAEKGLKAKGVISAGFFSQSIVQLCEYPKGKHSNDCSRAELWRMAYTAQ